MKIITKLGEKIVNDYQSYRYLGESIQTYLTPDAIKKLCLDAGFDQVRIVNLPEDVATIHIAQKS
ncbi:MAG: class I SAM-dependent methyltransferase [Gammaproteobacteria bacterium]